MRLGEHEVRVKIADKFLNRVTARYSVKEMTGLSDEELLKFGTDN